MLDNIDVDFCELSTQCIEKKWCELATRAVPIPFLDWGWVSSWLDSLPSLPIVLEAKYEGKIVGLGIFCEVNKTVFPGIKIKQLWLHRCGNQKHDQIWIEHNDFLLDAEWVSVTRQSMLQFLSTRKCSWDELYLGMATQLVVNEFSQFLPQKRVEVHSPSFIANLSQKHTLQDYLADLSKNTRNQINRTKRILEGQGVLDLTAIDSEQDNLQALTEVSEIHREKWGSTEFGSGFSNDIFVKFHQNMLVNFPKTSQLYRLSLSNTPLAYIYIIKGFDTWYFYLSAIKNSDDNRVKVGLLAHALVIEDAIKHNVDAYSFLAGMARYKKSMSNTPESVQQLVCFYKPSPIIVLRESLRKLKRLFFTQPAENN